MRNKSNWFIIFTIAYFISYALPAFWEKPTEWWFGIQCAFFATYLMFTSPITFVGNFANVMVLVVFILKIAKSDKLLQLPLIAKALLIGLALISVTTWIFYMSIAPMHIGYYCWSIACVGIVSTYLLTPTVKLNADIMDHLID